MGHTRTDEIKPQLAHEDDEGFCVCRLIVPAATIPEGSRVTKRTGRKIYVLRRVIKVFNTDNTNSEMRAHNGAVYLVDDRGNINAYDGSTELVWHIALEELRYLLEGEDS